MIKQCSVYSAKIPLIIGRCKPKKGDLFWVTSPSYSNVDFVKIQRKGKGSLNTGYLVSVVQLLEFFEPLEF
jgi:hypothetical protein